MNKLNLKLIKEYQSLLKKKNLPIDNIKSLSNIFSFWLEAINYIHLNFLPDRKKKLLKKNLEKNNLPLLVIEYEKKKLLTEKFVRNKRLSIFNPFFYLIKFLDNFILWDVFNKKLKFLISYIFFKNFIFLKYDYDEELKNQYFNSLKKIKLKNKNFYKFYLKLIPNIFFQKYNPIIKKKNIYLSSVNFLFNNSYINIFFRIESPKIHGLQHGMGYDFVKNTNKENKISKYEKKISQKFIHLYPLGKSYGRYNVKFYINHNKKKILWVQRRFLTNFEKYLLGNYGELLANKSSLKLLDKKLSQISNLFYSLHDKNFLLKPKKCKKFFYDDKIENIVGKQDILIFDSVVPTLLHFAIKNNINFFIILDNKFNFNILNHQYRKYLKFLFKNKFIFLIKEFERFKKEIDIVRKDSNYYRIKINKLKNFSV